MIKKKKDTYIKTEIDVPTHLSQAIEDWFKENGQGGNVNVVSSPNALIIIKS